MKGLLESQVRDSGRIEAQNRCKIGCFVTKINLELIYHKYLTQYDKRQKIFAIQEALLSIDVHCPCNGCILFMYLRKMKIFMSLTNFSQAFLRLYGEMKSAQHPSQHYFTISGFLFEKNCGYPTQWGNMGHPLKPSPAKLNHNFANVLYMR